MTKERVWTYVLDECTPRPEPDHRAWGDFMSDPGRRRVALTEREGIMVSTMFLGLDHRHHGSGSPLLFETMIFCARGILPELHDWQYRCATWSDAEATHARACRLVEDALNGQSSDFGPSDEDEKSELCSREGETR